MVKLISLTEWLLSITILLTLIVSACMPIQENTDSSFEFQAEMSDSYTPTPIPSSTKILFPSSTVTPSLTFSPTASPTPSIPIELSPLFNKDLAVIDSSNVTNLVELSQFGDGYLISIEISSDGTTAAAVFSNGVEVYNLETMEQQSVFFTSLKFDKNFFNFQLSPNGQLFAIIKPDQMEIWQTDSGYQTHQTFLSSENIQSNFIRHRMSPPDIQFSADSKSLMINDSEIFRLISTETGEIIKENSLISATCFSPDGKHIAVVATSKGDHVDVYNTVTGEIDYSIKGPTGAFLLSFSPDEDHIAIAYKNTIWVWDYKENQLVNTLYGQNSDTSNTKMMYTNDGHMLVIDNAHNPTGVRLWDMTTGNQIINLSEHRYPVLSPDKTRLVTFHSQTYHYYIWDLITKTPLVKIDQGYHQEQVVHFLPDGKHVNIYYHELVYGDGMLPFAQYNLEDGSITIDKREEILGSVEILFFPKYNSNQDANILLTWRKDPHNFFENKVFPLIMEVRNPFDGSILHSIELSLQPGWYQFSELQENENLYERFVSYSSDLFSRDLFSFIRGTALGRYKSNNPRLTIYRRELISPDNLKVVAQAGNDLIVWNIGHEEEIARQSFLGSIIAFEFSADGEKVFLVHSPQGHNYKTENVSFWDINTGNTGMLTSYDAHFISPGGGWKYCNNRPLSISHDGKLLAVSGNNCTVRIISALNYNEEICSFSPSIGSNGIMMFSPNSDLIATAFSGGEIQFWNTENCEIVHTIYEHNAPGSDKPTINFSFSPNSTLLGISFGSWPEYAFGSEWRPNIGYEGGTISFWGTNH